MSEWYGGFKHSKEGYYPKDIIMARSRYDGIEFDIIEGAYYNSQTDIFLSEDDAAFMELPKESEVMTAAENKRRFNWKDDRSITIDEAFLSYFKPSKMDTFKEDKQEFINKTIKDKFPPDLI